MEEKRCYGCMKLKTSSPICEHCGYDERTRNESHRLPAGTVLKEQYLVGRVLGQGGFGITYLGWDIYLDIPVAIKEYYPAGVVMRDTTMTMDVVSCSGDEGVRFRNNKERFLREAKMLARFSQVPEIVQVKNFFLANNTAYIVMEYVEGTNLKQYVADHGGKLPPEEVLSILRPVIEGLCKVHKAGLVHRDISPDNIMMLPGGGVKLLDFGAVRDVGEAAVDRQLTKSTEAILKQGYAPIEQYQKRGSLGPWTDVYALCATVYYCLTGEVPPEPKTEIGPGEKPDKEKPITQEKPDQKKTITGEQPHKKTPGRRKHPASLRKKQKFLIAGIGVVVLLICLLPLLSGGGSSPDKMESTTEADGSIVSGKCGKSITWELDLNTGNLALTGSGEMRDYKSIWRNESLFYPPWNNYQDQITSVTIGEGIRNVGDCAFFGCSNLKSVQFASTVKNIGNHTFWGCGLEELALPEKLTTIGDGAFSGNPLKNVVLPDSVRYIGACCFDRNDQLESVTIGPDTRLNYDIWNSTPIFGCWDQELTIRGYANSMAEDYAGILGCTFETIGVNTWDEEGQCGKTLFYHLDREAGFLKIDGEGDMWDFNGTWMQREEHKNGWVANRELPPWAAHQDEIFALSIGDGVTSIGEQAFSCSSIIDVYFGSSLKTIRCGAFLESKVDEIVLPNHITEIQHNVFNWCEQLWYVVVPDGIKLENAVFNQCHALEQIYISSDSKLVEYPDTTPFSQPGEPDMPENLTIYSLPGSDAERFAQEYGIPFAVGYRGLIAEVEGQCGDDVWWFKSGDTLVLYGTGDTWLYRISDQDREEWALRDWPSSWLNYGDAPYYEYRHEIRSILVLPGVEGLNHSLFCDMDNLEYVDFGTVVSTHCTFQNCGLTEVVMPETMLTVGEFVFHGCYNLRKITIQNGSSSVGMGLFEDCTSLDEVWFSGKERIGDWDLFDQYGDASYSDHVTFYVKAGSSAERYAKEKSIPYEIVK